MKHTTHTVSVSQLGLSIKDENAKNNALLLNSELKRLFDDGVREIYMDKSYPVDAGYDYKTNLYSRRVLHLKDFRFYGPGRFIGLYDVQVYDEICGYPVAFNNTNIQIRKLPKKEINVVIFGDSISLDWADSLTLGVCQSSIIKAEMEAQNSGYKFNFINRAYGGQTWRNANSKPSSFPSWYTNHSMDWVDCVIAEDPDIVILAFGMNDKETFDITHMSSTVNRIKASVPGAHLIMCTCLVPSRSSPFNDGSGVDGPVSQQGRNFVAGAERTYAIANGISVFDFNRYLVQSRDGNDPVLCELQEVEGAMPESGAYIFPQCTDFAFEAKISGWDKTSPIYINCGGDQVNDNIFIGSHSNRFLVVGAVKGSGTYHSARSDLEIPDCDFWLVTTILNNECHVYIGLDTDSQPKDGTRNILITSFRVIRHGGKTIPKIGTGGTSKGNITTIRAFIGLPTPRQKTLTDAQMWSIGDETAIRKIPYGGNGINHPSAKGLARVVAPVLQAQDLRVVFCDIELSVSVGESRVDGASAKVSDGILYMSGEVNLSTRDDQLKIDGWEFISKKELTVIIVSLSGFRPGAIVAKIGSGGVITAADGRLPEKLLLNSSTLL